MTKDLIGTLKRWRENYYLSQALSAAAKPIHALCSSCAQQIQTKIRRNGASIRLLNGKTMRVAKDCGISLASVLYWQGLAGVEPETSRALRFFFERSEVFVDVGANYGLYSILGALWNPNLRVVAFEPLTPIYECLRKNIAINHLEDRITCENLALSNRSGSATFYLPPSEGKDLESTGTLAQNSWQVRQRAQPLQVDAVRLDDYESSHPMRVDLIKIDVEDFEADVLRGMAGLIRRDRPFIVCEILPRNREHKNERTRQALQALNYAAYWITPSGYIRVTRFDFEREFTNFLLSPVSIPAEILSDPSALWQLKQQQIHATVA
jgi:FkbM family methyltransferase